MTMAYSEGINSEAGVATEHMKLDQVLLSFGYEE